MKIVGKFFTPHSSPHSTGRAAPYTPHFQVSRLAWVVFFALLASPAFAHKIQTAADVGGTLHIEPNDDPKAGQLARAWFALTRKGGQIIPLQQCNCKLAVYSQPQAKGAAPLLAPPLKAISAERYRGIPGAEMVFPKPGIYQLQLSGTPTAGADFKPFELKFTVTVAVGSSVRAVQPQTTQTARLKASPQTTQAIAPSNSVNNQWYIPAIALALLLSVGCFWVVKRRWK